MDFIFVSTDGVLCNQNYINMIINRGDNYVQNHQNQIDKSKLSMINYLVSKTNASVILMGKWRLQYSLEKLNEMLKKSGGRFEARDSTPYIYKHFSDFRSANHVDEVECYLDKTYQRGIDVGKFVILDDRSDWGKYQKHLVKVNYDKGLRHLDIEKCLDHFGIPYKKL